jgi:hypothetical protein
VKPSLAQYIFAKNWPAKVYFSVAAAFGVGVAVTTCQPSMAMFSDWGFLLLFVVSVLAAPVLFFFLSLPLAWMVLGPLYWARGKLNGAPFHVGDHVRILVGPHRDHVGQVYAVWDERRQVRVELDAEAKKDCSDVFSFTQVCRDGGG